MAEQIPAHIDEARKAGFEPISDEERKAIEPPTIGVEIDRCNGKNEGDVCRRYYASDGRLVVLFCAAGGECRSPMARRVR